MIVNPDVTKKPLAATTPKPSRMQLANVKSGVIAAPLRVLIYGAEGIGKSTFASGAPKPIWLGADRGTNHLDIARLPQPRDFDEVIDAVRMLRTEAHEYETLVIDPINWIEPLAWKKVCKANGWENITTPGYGDGYKATDDIWRVLVHELERLQDARRMNIVLVAHSDKKSDKNPDIEAFDRYVIAMYKGAAAIFRQWAEYVLFARQHVWAEAGADKQVRGKTNGARVIHTQWMPAYDAKSRPTLPATLPLSWTAFVEARAKVDPARAKDHAAELRVEVGELLATLADEETTKKVTAYLGATPTVAELEEVINVINLEIETKKK
ncbi:MAG: hypothetical protein JWM74_4524, partial [Myxococcaceae bacterium]|nr:hypothetical protein [Myxococcaceae bacterium]